MGEEGGRGERRGEGGREGGRRESGREGRERGRGGQKSVGVSEVITRGVMCLDPPTSPPLRNYYLIFGLISETCLAMVLAFCPGVSSVFKLRGLR